ncbi:MAG: serine/threonine-protein kinase [Myxococcaceae bacterium]|nr:serine/threonine-protein kinase [Myxococcaceae bacterium]
MAELSPGTLVAQIYRVREPLGAGGFGETYLADNTTLKGGEVVVKTVASPDQGLEEAQTLVALQSPNVVRVLAFDEERRAIVMERAIGQPLANLIGRIDLLTSIRIAEAVAGALSDLERSQLVHRDVKPENIMVQLPEGGGRLHVKLIDFGIALRAGKPLTSDPVGSPLYCPVEQHDRNMPPHPTDDVYALGGVLFNMVANRPPFEPAVLTEAQRLKLLDDVGLPPETSQVMLEAVQLRLAHERDEVASLMDVAGALASSERERFILEKLDQLLSRMMAKRREDRVRARSVEAELDSLASSFSEASTSVTSLQQLARVSKRPTATLVLPGKKRLEAKATSGVTPQTANTDQLASQLKGSSTGKWVALAAVVLLLLGGAYAVTRPPVEPPAPIAQAPSVEPKPLPEVVEPKPTELVAVEVPVVDAGFVDELSPLAKVTPVAVKAFPKAAPAGQCVVSEQWKRAIETDLGRLKQAVAQRADADLFGRFEDDEDVVVQLAKKASTEADCVAVNRRVDALEKKYLR